VEALCYNQTIQQGISWSPTPKKEVKMAATARKDRVRAGTDGRIKSKRHREDILGFRWTQSDYPNRHGVQKLIGPARPFNSTGEHFLVNMAFYSNGGDR
jgi:hypothetical protein